MLAETDRLKDVVWPSLQSEGLTYNSSKKGDRVRYYYSKDTKFSVTCNRYINSEGEVIIEVKSYLSLVNEKNQAARIILDEVHFDRIGFQNGMSAYAKECVGEFEKWRNRAIILIKEKEIVKL